MCSYFVPFCPRRVVKAFTKPSGREGARSRGSFPVTSPGSATVLGSKRPSRRGLGVLKALEAPASHGLQARFLTSPARLSVAAPRGVCNPRSLEHPPAGSAPPPRPDPGSRSRRGACSGREAGQRERPRRKAASGRTMWRRRRLMGARHHGGAQ